MKTLKRFFDDIHRIANAPGLDFSPALCEFLMNLAAVSTVHRTISLSQEDRDLLIEAATKFRRNGPRIKKEVA